MTERDFVYWLKGFSEAVGEDGPTIAQWTTIQEELQKVFNKVTPARTYPIGGGIANWPYTATSPSITGVANTMITC